MRLRLGRPSLTPYDDRFDLPDATSAVGVSWGGVSTLLLDDGQTQVLTDGFFTRPGLLRVGTRKLVPDAGLVREGLDRLGVRRGSLAAVIPVHTHFDHAMDSGLVAEQTGARVVGGRSAVNVGRGAGLPATRLQEVADGEVLELGTWRVTFVVSDHCPPDRYPGEITEPLVPPTRAKAWRCGEAWSLLLESGGATALVQGSAGFVPGALAGQRAEVAYLGVGQLGLMDPGYMSDYWEHTVRAVGAGRVVLIHWDDFFVPLTRLRALPYAGDDLEASMRVLDDLARQDGVTIHFPRPWHRHDPWS
jgi:L-ascorbate metabolism protein UlaG (beta-lactamase superfamily)